MIYYIKDNIIRRLSISIFLGKNNLHTYFSTLNPVYHKESHRKNTLNNLNISLGKTSNDQLFRQLNTTLKQKLSQIKIKT